jgi:hypothetical protein
VRVIGPSAVRCTPAEGGPKFGLVPSKEIPLREDRDQQPAPGEQTRAPLPDRLESLGYKPLRRKPEGGPKALTPRMKLLADYMVFGCPYDFVRRITRPVAQVDGKTGEITTVQKPVEPGEPLSLIEAADLLRIRRRNARELVGFPIFKHEYASQLQRLRDGEKAASVHTLVEVRDDKGLGKAADRKVRMQAALAVLGEGEGNRGPTLTIQNNIGISQRAGLVLRIPETAPRIPLEEDKSE